MKLIDAINNKTFLNYLDDKKKKLYSDVIDCVEISLSKESDNFEVDPSISLDELLGIDPSIYLKQKVKEIERNIEDVYNQIFKK